MLTESEIKAYTVDIPNDIQAALRASGSLQQDGSPAHCEHFKWGGLPCKKIATHVVSYNADPDRTFLMCEQHATRRVGKTYTVAKLEND